VATTLKSSNLNVEIKESITLNGKDFGNTIKKQIPSVRSILDRVVNVPTSEVSLYTTSTSVSGAQMLTTAIQYARITNLDNKNYVELTLTNADSEEVGLKLNPGHSFILFNHNGSLTSSMFALDFTDATCDYNNSFTITCDANKQIKVGQAYTGSGIPAGTTVATVNTPGAVTSFTGSAETTGGAKTNQTLTFTRSYDNITAISAFANTTSCDVQVFLAST
tara:strand:+ start:364 stop:1026 length:663 start_codon:yes stop_codon:yes gene_type:complete